MGVLSLGRGGRLLRFDGFCSVIGITVMRRKQYEEPEDEPCLLSPEDDPAMLDTPEDEPVGPEWWEGRWPAGGIASLEDLERWVNAELEEMISLNWTHPKTIGGEFARKIGRQALRNATRYLDRHGPGNHPPQPIADQLEHIEQIEAALGALLRYIRQEQGDQAVTPADTTKGRSKAAAKLPLNDMPKTGWTEDSVNVAIRKYKSERSKSYDEMVKGVREGLKGASDAARKMFGRNEIARRLGMSKGSVSKSEAWRAVAEELNLSPDKGTSLRSYKRVGFDYAIEKKAQEEENIVIDKVARREVITAIEKSLPRKDAERLVERLELGTIDEEQAWKQISSFLEQKEREEDNHRKRRGLP